MLKDTYRTKGCDKKTVWANKSTTCYRAQDECHDCCDDLEVVGPSQPVHAVPGRGQTKSEHLVYYVLWMRSLRFSKLAVTHCTLPYFRSCFQYFQSTLLYFVGQGYYGRKREERSQITQGLQDFSSLKTVFGYYVAAFLAPPKNLLIADFKSYLAA